MDQRTRDHLQTAQRCRRIALLLLDASSPDPPPHEWAVVLMFCSAVHDVNAYLWELQRFEPADHAERQFLVRTVGDLRSAHAAYARLSAGAFDARYLPHFRTTDQRARERLDDLDAVASAITTALNRGS